MSPEAYQSFISVARFGIGCLAHYCNDGWRQLLAFRLQAAETGDVADVMAKHLLIPNSPQMEMLSL